MTFRTARSRRPATRLALAAVLALAFALAAACTPAPGGAVAVVGRVDGFDRPWDVQFTPDGTALVTERPGTLSTVVGGARRLLASVPGVVASGEGGLMGLAIDPAFSTNRWVYLCHTSATDVRLVRYRVLPGYTGIADATPVVTGIDRGAGNRHQGCRPRFGPDGDLWLATGDAAVGSTPQDRTSLAGKVLRLRADGSPSPANPGVVAPGAGWNPLVHTYGHRNVQGLAFRPGDGAAFSVEHGTNCDDEINRLVAGANYGWDPNGAGGTYDESVPMTFAGATPAVWASGCPTIATSGAVFLEGATWGARAGQLAVASLKGAELRFFRIDGSTFVSSEVVLVGQGRLRSVTLGPDGSLWVTTDAAPGSLLQIRPAS